MNDGHLSVETMERILSLVGQKATVSIRRRVDLESSRRMRASVLVPVRPGPEESDPLHATAFDKTLAFKRKSQTLGPVEQQESRPLTKDGESACHDDNNERCARLRSHDVPQFVPFVPSCVVDIPSNAAGNRVDRTSRKPRDVSWSEGAIADDSSGDGSP